MAYLVFAPSLKQMRRLLQLPLLTLVVACCDEAPSPPTTLQELPETDEPTLHTEDTPSTATGETLVPPPPRRPLEGVHGFTSRSRIEFGALPDLPHRLTATYTFPGRARWYLEPADAKRGQRSVRYQSGPQVWELAPGKGEAVRYQGDQEAQALLQLRLRRAALLWPLGFDWKEGLLEGQGALIQIAELESGELLGARFRTSDSPPASFFSRLPGGGMFEELLDVEWTEGPLGLRPARWVLFSGGVKVWTEEIERLHTDVRYVDGHFLPPHLRTLPAQGEVDTILLVEVPARVRRRHALSVSTWEEALAEAKRIIASTRRLELPGEVDSDPVFELDDDALPHALFVRLSVLGEEIPEGWEEAAGESALSRLIPDGRLPGPAEVAVLSASRPEGALTGTPRLRIGLVDGEIETTQLLLPLTVSVSGD